MNATVAPHRIFIALFGDGRSGPQIAALRAWAGRFDYVDEYLPRLYREQLFGADAQASGAATPADFLSRSASSISSPRP